MRDVNRSFDNAVGCIMGAAFIWFFIICAAAITLIYLAIKNWG